MALCLEEDTVSGYVVVLRFIYIYVYIYIYDMYIYIYIYTYIHDYIYTYIKKNGHMNTEQEKKKNIQELPSALWALPVISECFLQSCMTMPWFLY